MKVFSAIISRMPLSIKNATAERLARQVAGETGESITEAIRKSLEERWERLKARRRNRHLNGQIVESSTFVWSEQTWKLFRSTPSRSRSLVPLGAVLEKAAIRRRSISETVLRMLLLGLRASQS